MENLSFQKFSMNEENQKIIFIGSGDQKVWIFNNDIINQLPADIQNIFFNTLRRHIN